MTREKAIEMCKSIKHYLTGGNPVWSKEEVAEAMTMAIEALQVDLVRCGECVHGKVETEPRRPWEGDITCKLDGTDREWYKGDYCSYGERRSDE